LSRAQVSLVRSLLKAEVMEVVSKHPPARRTSVDLVFDHLYQEISLLNLLPGTKISEADVAARFGVSRQPVRDAFSRLEMLELVVIRPQKATEVRGFSKQAIDKARFIRVSVESEVLRRAADLCDASGAKTLEKCLEQQRKIVEDETFDAFSEQDYLFHKALCEIAGVDFAFEVISSEKAKVDRLCVLSHNKGDRLSELLQDHKDIAAYVIEGKKDKAVTAGMLHLSRLDATIEKILLDHPEYFEN